MSLEPDPKDFLPKDQTHKTASVILWPWTFDAEDFYFEDAIADDRKFFSENPHRTFRLRHASQLECAVECAVVECAVWAEKTNRSIPEDCFLYVAIRCTESSYTMRYMIAERCGIIDDKESLGRIFFEGKE